MLKHPPYIETPRVRLVQPTSGSISTDDVDCFRQGISIRTVQHRFCGTQPKIWVGDVSHVLKPQVFGVADLYPEGGSYDDTGRQFNVYDVITYMSGTATLPVSEFFVDAGDDDGSIEEFDGVIEPFDVRNVVIRQTRISSSHEVKGEFGAGNKDGEFTSQVDQRHRCRERNISSISMAFVESMNIHDSVGVDTPYDDSLAMNTSRLTDVINDQKRANFVSILSRLTGSTDSSLLDEYDSMTAGYIFHDSSCRQTDSIAYGGYMRYKRFVV